jgi:cell division protein FtsB
MIIKRNRGRQWLDWQRRLVTSAHYIGAAVCLLLLVVLVFGDMGLLRYISMPNSWTLICKSCNGRPTGFG